MDPEIHSPSNMPLVACVAKGPNPLENGSLDPFSKQLAQSFELVRNSNQPEGTLRVPVGRCRCQARRL